MDIYAFGTKEFPVQLPGITNSAKYCDWQNSYSHDLYLQQSDTTTDLAYIEDSSDEAVYDAWVNSEHVHSVYPESWSDPL